MDSAYIIILFIVLVSLGVIAKLYHNKEPLREKIGTVLNKRQDVAGWNYVSTSYFVTFQFEDGSRNEFRVSGKSYGLLTEGDQGVVEFQGTWFRGFQRFN